MITLVVLAHLWTVSPRWLGTLHYQQQRQIPASTGRSHTHRALLELVLMSRAAPLTCRLSYLLLAGLPVIVVANVLDWRWRGCWFKISLMHHWETQKSGDFHVVVVKV